MKLERYISPNYLNQQRWLHKQPKGYGGRGDKWAPAVIDLIKTFQILSVLDYGCGQGTLGNVLRTLKGVKVYEYDPAIKYKTECPELQVDLVVCTDVMEHVEPDKLGVVIDHLFRLTKKVLFLVIATRPSKKFLNDGRNSHLIIEPNSWWQERFTHPHFSFVDPPKSPLKEPSREWVALLVRK